jgi:hypothetical protein
VSPGGSGSHQAEPKPGAEIFFMFPKKSSVFEVRIYELLKVLYLLWKGTTLPDVNQSALTSETRKRSH